jgi:hypothetical protein
VKTRKQSRLAPLTVAVSVDGRRWRRVASLSDSGPDDTYFTLETARNGSTAVRFGDGVHGASPGEGSTVAVTYTTGNGTKVHLSRTANPCAEDQALWVVIRDRGRRVPGQR